MEQKAQDQVSNKEAEFPYCIEEEMKYNIMEKRVSMAERTMKAMELNRSFSGALHINYWDCAYPENEEVIDLMFEEDEDMIYDLLDDIDIDFESESPVPN